jgi:hypothetical protein
MFDNQTNSSLLRNVPEGRCDRSLARSAWDSAIPKEPSRRVRCDSRRFAHRFDDWSDEGRSIDKGRIIGLDSSGISYARSYRTLRDGSFEGRFPRHFVPGYDRCCPYGTRWQTFRNSI